MTSIFRSFLDFFIRTFRYIIFCKEYLDSLTVEIYELKSKRDDVERDILRARREGKEPKSQVTWWIGRIKALERKFVKIRGEFERRFKFPGNFAPNILSSYRIGMRADEMIAEACYLKSKGLLFNEIANKVMPDRFEEVPCVPTVGMDLVLKKLQQVVSDDAVGIIGIYGMGGVGKTAVLSRFHNEFLSDATDLEVIIFIETCRDLDVESIQKKVQNRLGISWKNRKSQKEKAAMLYRMLCKMKFVLILDDMWKPLDLQMVGIPIPKQGSKCKIIVATRNEDICNQMDATEKIKIETLTWDVAWKLFADKVGEDTISSHPGIRQQAEIFVRKCGGLPLALITVARALASKRSPEEWKHAVTIMSNNPSQLPGIAEHLLYPLKLSYDQLPNDTLRSCALHFALYWEGCRLHKNLLQEYWIGEGIVDDFNNMEQANNKICYLLGILSSCSLIDRVDADGYTKMHPMVRAAALWIVCEQGKEENKWFVREKRELGSLKKLRYLGLNWTADIARIPDGLIRSLSELRVLRMIVSYRSWKVGSIGDGVNFEELEALKRLRILDITIGTTAALKRLSQSRRLAPSTVALLIKGCQGLTAIELPTTLGRTMESIKWLRMSHSSELEEVVIGSGGGDQDELIFPELENLVLEFLHKAKIFWMSSFIGNLQGLYIYGCNGMEQLIYYKDDDDESVEDNRYSRGVTPFPNLKEIALRGLSELKRVSDERRVLVFPSLESIEVVDCPKLKKIRLAAGKLREIRCHRSWWDQLEWEDEASKSEFQLILKPLQ
ncbi:disease resistance protein RPS2-like [Canna indica]|uniref:Disease resistance protein RPS2-like n=1 Tax=Canna indica TaxID=4628 RepID=A0AAQ3KP76_9LILI|nr:disease resistance protein RPS2-like [Canna indica]